MPSNNSINKNYYSYSPSSSPVRQAQVALTPALLPSPIPNPQGEGREGTCSSWRWEWGRLRRCLAVKLAKYGYKHLRIHLPEGLMEYSCEISDSDLSLLLLPLPLTAWT